jgi:hypothetical protein
LAYYFVMVRGQLLTVQKKQAKNSNALKRVTQGIRTTGPVYKKIQRVWLGITMSSKKSMMKTSEAWEWVVAGTGMHRIRGSRYRADI